MPIRAYEDVQKVIPCSSAGIGTLSRLGSEAATVTGPDGSISEGVWHWWTSDACPDPKLTAAFDLMNQGRSDKGLDPIPACPMPDVPGKTCKPRFYPSKTVFPDQSYQESNWTWVGANGGDDYGMKENWRVYFTPEEAQLYATLQSDDYLRAFDARTIIAIYYSLLNYKCVGKINAVLDPSPVSPQSLAGKYDTGSQFWLESWERGLRDRIWMVRQDLRQVQLPDGRLETGLRPPADISRPPACTSTTGQIIGYVAAAAMALAGMPPALEFALNLPSTALGLKDMIGKMTYAAKVQAALMGQPSPVEKVLMEKASGETKSPTESGSTSGGAVSSSGGGLPWLLIAGAAAALLS
jgi:hypothetical protein